MRSAAGLGVLLAIGIAAGSDPAGPPQVTTEYFVVPIDRDPAKIDEPPAVQAEAKSAHGPLGPSWDATEYLLWWVAPQPVPPLLVRSRTSALPILGSRGSSLIIGGDHLAALEHSGGRFLTGWSLNSEQTIGVEFGFFFLGTRSQTLAASSPGDVALARPFLAPLAETELALSVARPGISSGGLELVASSRVQGAEVNGLTNLFCSPPVRLDALVGFRFLQVHEGLRIGQRTVFGPGDRMVFDVADQFDGHNRFYGGQLGLRADWRHGPAFVELLGKVAIGQTAEVVKISGLTVTHVPGRPDVAVPGGVLGLPTNSGRFTQSDFAVVPEATVRVGWARERTRWFVGYNFLYLSRLARPGDQIDRVLNPTQIPLERAFPRLVGPERPEAAIRITDFWAQGLVLGVEVRY